MTGPEARPALEDIRFRRPIEADHPVVVAQVNDWWGGRRMRALLPRLWFRHFSELSWIAETEEGRLMGFLVGFISPDHPDEAVVHLIGTSPNRRRRGLGRATVRALLRGCPRAWRGSRHHRDVAREPGLRRVPSRDGVRAG